MTAEPHLHEYVNKQLVLLHTARYFCLVQDITTVPSSESKVSTKISSFDDEPLLRDPVSKLGCYFVSDEPALPSPPAAQWPSHLERLKHTRCMVSRLQTVSLKLNSVQGTYNRSQSLNNKHGKLDHTHQDGSVVRCWAHKHRGHRFHPMRQAEISLLLR